MDQEHAPEDVCWGQPADSLALSLSPAGRSSSNLIREEDAGGDANSSKAEDGTDEDNQLVGVYIWSGGGNGGDEIGGGGGDDNDHPDDQRLAGGHHSDNRRGMFDHNDGRSSGQECAPLRAETAYREHHEDPEDIARSETSPNSMEPRGQHLDEMIEDDRLGESPRSMYADSISHGELGEAEGKEAEQHGVQRALGFAEQEEWSDDEEDEWNGDDAGNFAPAWDEGRPAEIRSVNVDGELDDVSGSSNEVRSPRTQNQPLEAAECTQDDSHMVPSNRGHEGAEPSLAREGSVRRRTRDSLDRERRRLDRLPRSQRLRQVKGHPLGGMTLLELEERHLLDVGIGQMARQLAKRQAGGVRQADTDLLRRSARLLRRAQEERDAQHSFGDNRENRRHGGMPSSCRDTSGTGPRAGSARRGGRRPASASRERCRAVSPSFSLESEESASWARSFEARAGRTDPRAYTGQAVPPNMGLYSGGGARCSLKHRRPMSAKPALTCGSGWEPGRERTRSRSGGQRDPEDTGATPLREIRDARADGFDPSCDGSDLSDLGPHGIVEYTDGEEGPFNVDELERVAASYLLRPRGSVCLSSAAVLDEDRCADDGSVYIYREGDGSPSGREGDREPSDGDSEAARSSTHSHSLGEFAMHAIDNGGHRWQEEQSSESFVSAQVREDSSFGEKCGEGMGGHPRCVPRQRPVGDSSPALRGQGTGGNGGRAEREKGATFYGSDTATGKYRNEDVDAGQQRPRLSDGGQGWNQTEDSKEILQGSGGSYRPPDLHDERWSYEQKGLLDNHGRVSRKDRGGPVDKAPDVSVHEPGASYTPKIDRGLHGTGRGREATRSGREATVDTISAKVGQVAIRLREMVLERQASAGRSLRQVFGHFDRRGCGYVNAAEMRDAMADLRLKLSPSEAHELHSVITLDGGDRLSFGEFAVFVSDPYHSEIQANVCGQAAAQLEALGRRSFNLDAVFHPALRGTLASGVDAGTGGMPPNARDHATMRTMKGRQDSLAGQAAEQHGSCGERYVVSAADFVEGLKTLGLQLSTSDTQRLLVRFDVHGDGCLSAGRFVSMIESSRPWTRTLIRLAHQDEADEEADACLRAYRTHGRWPAGQTFNDEIIEMARYIGIRVSSDASLLWIAAEALAAPLPDGWLMYKGQEGRWFYHSELTGQSRWDHPLDPHFRRIYLRERFGSTDEDAEVGLESREMSPGYRRSIRGTIVSRPPAMLPPRRMRPNVLDYPSKKALENLRTSRLNGSGGSSTAASARREPESLRINSRRINREISRDRGGAPVSPSGGGTRRRPVSASALREGVEKRSMGLKAIAADKGSGNGSGSACGFGSITMVGGRYAEAPFGKHRNGRGPTARLRRPRSAKAALQGPPPDRQERPNDRHHTERPGSRHAAPMRKPKSPTLVDELWTMQDSTKRSGLVADGGQGGGQDDERWFGRGEHHPREDDTRVTAKRGDDPVATTHGRLQSSDRDASDALTVAEEERAWLLERLADLCSKLGDVKIFSRGGDRHHSGGIGRHSRNSSSVERASSDLQYQSHALGRRGNASEVLNRKEELFSQESRGRPLSSISERLRGQVFELDGRIRGLQKQLHNPPLPQDGLYHRQSRGFSRGGTEAAAARVRQRDGATRRGGPRHSSQDDLAYRAPGIRAGLSKTSWPPPTGMASRHAGSSSSSSDSLMFAGGEAAAAARIPRWAGVATGTAGSGRDRGGRPRGGGDVEKRRSERRSRNPRGHLAGIVLI